MRFLNPLCGLALSACLVAGAYANQKSVGGSKGSLITVSYNGARSSNQARSALLNSMQRGSKIPVTAIITLNNVLGDDCEYKIRLDQNKEGWMKRTILHPLKPQGVIQLDDGLTWQTYLPNENKLMIVPSSRNEFGDPSFRISLADKNYVLKSAKGEKIAGRDTVVVTAQPRYTGMALRRYHLDDSTKFMLRLELVENNKKRVLLDTQTVVFPSDLPDALFKLKPVRTPEREVFEAPRDLTSVSAATKKLGFKPVLPENLPYGFVIHHPQIAGEDDSAFVTLKLTDGLARATVYQLNAAKSGQVKAMEGTIERYSNGIRYQIRGELSSGVAAKILDAFVKQGAKGLGAYSETPQPKQLLAELQAKMPHGNGADDLSGSHHRSVELIWIARIELI